MQLLLKVRLGTKGEQPSEMVCRFFRFRDSQKTCHWQLFCVLRPKDIRYKNDF